MHALQHGQTTPWASWDSEEPKSVEWFNGTVLRMKLGDAELGHALSKICFELEANGGGRSVSNAGGFQSKDLTWRTDAALENFIELLHDPLVTFLKRNGQGSPPTSLEVTPQLCVRSAPTDLWANVNRPGDRNVVHNHGEPTSAVVASGVYYPAVGDDEGQAADTDAARLRLFVPAGTLELVPEAGTLLLFPTNLLHETELVPPGARARLSLAFNLRVRWLDKPLLRAAARGDAAEIRSLVAAGAGVDEADAVLGLRPMHLAAEGGHLAAVQALEELGADTSALSLEGSSPLGLAFDRGHVEVERYLGGERSAVRAALRERGLPPVRPASPSYPGVPLDRPDVMAAFDAAGLPRPDSAQQGSSSSAFLVGLALALAAVLGGVLALAGGI